MYVELYLEPTQTIIGGASLQKLQESFIVDVWLGSKYTSGIGFTIKFYNRFFRMSIFVWYGQKRLQNFFIVFLFLELIKKHVGLTLSWRRVYHKEASPVHLFALQINAVVIKKICYIDETSIEFDKIFEERNI